MKVRWTVRLQWEMGGHFGALSPRGLLIGLPRHLGWRGVGYTLRLGGHLGWSKLGSGSRRITRRARGIVLRPGVNYPPPSSEGGKLSVESLTRSNDYGPERDILGEGPQPTLPRRPS